MFTLKFAETLFNSTVSYSLNQFKIWYQVVFRYDSKGWTETDISEKRKSAEKVKKLAETILTYEGKLSEYQEEIKPVNLVFNQLQIIVKDELEHIESSRTKKVISTILSRLHDSVGNMIIE